MTCHLHVTRSWPRDALRAFAWSTSMRCEISIEAGEIQSSPALAGLDEIHEGGGSLLPALKGVDNSCELPTPRAPHLWKK